jgi:radical SAM protein with 4Fe4S-binding SPASM domain
MKIKEKSAQILLRREPGRGALPRFLDRASYRLMTPFRLRPIYGRLLRLKYLVRYATTDFFNDVTIETATACNRRCEYCPNSFSNRAQPEGAITMPTSLYESIIKQLEEIGFKGRISPHGYGEPLLDERLRDLVAYTHRMLPGSKIWIYTNGDFLSPPRYRELVDAGVNRFVVTQHGSEMSPAIRDLFSHLQDHPRRADILYMKIERGRTPLSNRGGLVDPGVRLNPRCGDPDNPLVIDAEGYVVICANDYFGRVKLGNVGKDRLLDIWKSRKFKEIRRQLRNRQYTLPICLNCTGQAEGSDPRESVRHEWNPY